eukprot:COSAG03_NODE_2272_length_2929_cov_3.107067_2_plen_110_part_00
MMATLNIPTLCYKPERAYLVFPMVRALLHFPLSHSFSHTNMKSPCAEQEGTVKAASGQLQTQRAMVYLPRALSVCLSVSLSVCLSLSLFLSVSFCQCVIPEYHVAIFPR